jgi:hypothetical protein
LLKNFVLALWGSIVQFIDNQLSKKISEPLSFEIFQVIPIIDPSREQESVTGVTDHKSHQWPITNEVKVHYLNDSGVVLCLVSCQACSNGPSFALFYSCSS